MSAHNALLFVLWVLDWSSIARELLRRMEDIMVRDYTMRLMMRLCDSSPCIRRDSDRCVTIVHTLSASLSYYLFSQYLHTS